MIIAKYQAIDIYNIWAGAENPFQPLADWFSGARFCRYENGKALVFKKFLGKWMIFRYDLRDIRIAHPSAIQLS